MSLISSILAFFAPNPEPDTHIVFLASGGTVELSRHQLGEITLHTALEPNASGLIRRTTQSITVAEAEQIRAALADLVGGDAR